MLRLNVLAPFTGGIGLKDWEIYQQQARGRKRQLTFQRREILNHKPESSEPQVLLASQLIFFFQFWSLLLSDFEHYLNYFYCLITALKKCILLPRRL